MISVVLATYNGEKYIYKQLESIVNQTIIPDEIIVCDDLSIDNTISIVNSFANKYNNVKWNVIINNKQLGFAKNFIKAVSLANGDYIFLSDQDDIWEIDKIKKMISIMQRYRKINILFSAYRCIDSSDNTLPFKYHINNSITFLFFSYLNKIKKYSYNSFIKSMNVAGMSMCVKKGFIDNFLNLDISNIKYHDLFLALYASIDNGLYFYKEILVNYRMHDNNAIGLKSAVGFKENRVIWLKKNVENQYLIKKNMVSNKIDNKYIDILNKVIKLNENRIDSLNSKKIFNLLLNIFRINLYPSLMSYFGDIKYVLN